MQIEASGGIVLVLATLSALAWANSPAKSSYFDLLETPIVVDAGLFRIAEDLQHWVNDGLLSVFFFLVGLEIKREAVHGELSQLRRAVVPIAAAAGGMVAPALIYVMFNVGQASAHGWGVPMATDIALALGMLSLMGRRVPLSLKMFLLALAVADDIGTIGIIAVFYSAGLEWMALGLAVLFMAAVVVCRRCGVRSLAVYAFFGLAAWIALEKSGVTPTLIGVALGFLTPARSFWRPELFIELVDGLAGRFREARKRDDWDGQQEVLHEIEELSRETEAPLERLERTIHPWVSFAVLPLFALANLGVDFSGGLLADAARSPITLGIVAGRLVGKPAGILLASFVVVRLGTGRLPGQVRWLHIAGVGLIASVGFTVPIFVSALAFVEPTQVGVAKVGLLLTSLVGGFAGILLLSVPAPSTYDAGGKSRRESANEYGEASLRPP